MLALLIALTVAGLVLAGGSAAAGTQSTSTAVTGCSPNPVAVADTTTCTVVVTDTSGSPTTPSGSVSFASDSSGTFGGSPCTLTAVDSSSATCQVTYTPTAGAGTHTITASYTADDGVHIDSADSAGVGVTVSPRSTTTSISCSPTTVALNQATTCTATVVDTDSGTSSFPQGSVSFGRGGPAGSAGTFSSSGSCTLAQLGMSTTTSHCSLTYTPTAGAGTHTVSASYTPNDSIHATSGDSTDASVTATTRSTSTQVTGCTPTSATIGTSTTCTVVVSDTASGTKSAPAGTVSFTTSGTGTFGGNPCTLAQIGTTTTSSCTVTYTPTSGTGTHTVKAGYTPNDAVHAASSDASGVGVTALARSTSTQVTGCTSTSLTIGRSTTCTVVVSDTASGTKSAPAGTVSFSDSGAGTFTGITCTSGSASSSCTVTYTPTSGTGTHTITATYAPNDSVHAGSGDATGFGITALARTTSTQVISCSPATVVSGNPASCTVHVSDTDLGTRSAPGGTVNFGATGAGNFSGSTCTLAQVGTTTTSACQVSYTPTSGTGTQTITAAYTPTDSVHAASIDTTGFPLNVASNGSTTSLSATPSPAVTNQNVTLSATVMSTTPPAGTITFLNGSAPIPGCVNLPVSASGSTGTTNCQTSFAAITSPEHLSAQFASNNAALAGSDSPTVSLSVGKDSTSISLGASTSSLSVGAPVTYTAIVAPAHPGAVHPTDSVSFFDGGASIPSCVNQPLTNGSATCTLSYGSLGSHSVTAVYRGDGNFSGSNSAAGAVAVQPLGIITSTMNWTFFFTPRYTKIQQFVVNRAPVGASILITCRGGGCPFAKRVINVSRCRTTKTHRCIPRRVATVDLEPRFLGRHLTPGAHINVQIVRPGWIGKYYLFTIRSAHKPRSQVSCIAPGVARPGVGC